MNDLSLSSKKITIWLCANYGIFILGFFTLGTMGHIKCILWGNFILDLTLVLISLILNIILFKKQYRTPLLGKITLLLVTLCFAAFIYFAFLMPENGLPGILFY